jgi:hypothetical protein
MPFRATIIDLLEFKIAKRALAVLRDGGEDAGTLK